jgi:NADPH:quinone reductase-like Zn-dependent oxidoreductase
MCTVTSERPEDLRFLADRVEAGELRAVVGARYPLEQAADAHRHVESGHKAGSVVLTLP